MPYKSRFYPTMEIAFCSKEKEREEKGKCFQNLGGWITSEQDRKQSIKDRNEHVYLSVFCCQHLMCITYYNCQGDCICYGETATAQSHILDHGICCCFLVLPLEFSFSLTMLRFWDSMQLPSKFYSTIFFIKFEAKWDFLFSCTCS